MHIKLVATCPSKSPHSCHFYSLSHRTFDGSSSSLRFGKCCTCYVGQAEGAPSMSRQVLCVQLFLLRLLCLGPFESTNLRAWWRQKESGYFEAVLCAVQAEPILLPDHHHFVWSKWLFPFLRWRIPH